MWFFFWDLLWQGRSASSFLFFSVDNKSVLEIKSYLQDRRKLETLQLSNWKLLQSSCCHSNSRQWPVRFYCSYTVLQAPSGHLTPSMGKQEQKTKNSKPIHHFYLRFAWSMFFFCLIVSVKKLERWRIAAAYRSCYISTQPRTDRVKLKFKCYRTGGGQRKQPFSNYMYGCKKSFCDFILCSHGSLLS